MPRNRTVSKTAKTLHVSSDNNDNAERCQPVAMPGRYGAGVYGSGLAEETDTDAAPDQTRRRGAG